MENNTSTKGPNIQPEGQNIQNNFQPNTPTNTPVQTTSSDEVQVDMLQQEDNSSILPTNRQN